MDRIKCGIVLPFFDAAEVAEAAVAAERAGWDGVFLAEVHWGVDAWIALGAAASATTRIRLGTMLTPAARIKPWDLASRVGTVDRLSGGRAQLAVGLGALHPGWVAFEAPTTRAERAALLDECLAIYDGLMHGQPFAFSGEHYTVTATDFYPPPPPVQQPRPPVWVVGAAPSRSMRRAARWDGLIPAGRAPDDPAGPLNPAEFGALVELARAHRAELGLPWEGYEVIAEGVTAGADPDAARREVAGFAAVGATWWIESDWSVAADAAGRAVISARIEAGPPM
ncbi:MAG: LLM class flavin-dependent oxidoreductase [Sporichthyaceae bacterium]